MDENCGTLLFGMSEFSGTSLVVSFYSFSKMTSKNVEFELFAHTVTFAHQRCLFQLTYYFGYFQYSYPLCMLLLSGHQNPVISEMPGIEL